MSGVQRAAQSIVVEVRRQFKEIAGSWRAKPTPTTPPVWDLCTKGALHEMVVPSLLAIVVPVVTGLILGAEAVVGLLGGVTVTGFVVAVFMSNAGGAWTTPRSILRRPPRRQGSSATRPPSWRYGGDPSRTPPARP